MKTSVAWAKDDPLGVEFVEASVADTALSAVGVAVGSEPVPYRLDYVLETAADFVTTRFLVTTRGEGWRRTLDLRRAADGEWSARTTADGGLAMPLPGVETPSLAGAVDVDLGLSPLTNTMPVLRGGLFDRAGSEDFLMAWVSVPDLTVTPAPQRYTVLDPARSGDRLVRFESLDGDFTAELTYDDHGFVLDYPGIAHRITA